MTSSWRNTSSICRFLQRENQITRDLDLSAPDYELKTDPGNSARWGVSNNHVYLRIYGVVLKRFVFKWSRLSMFWTQAQHAYVDVASSIHSICEVCTIIRWNVDLIVILLYCVFISVKFLEFVRPFCAVLPEIAKPERKVRFWMKTSCWEGHFRLFYVNIQVVYK